MHCLEMTDATARNILHSVVTLHSKNPN